MKTERISLLDFSHWLSGELFYNIDEIKGCVDLKDCSPKELKPFYSDIIKLLQKTGIIIENWESALVDFETKKDQLSYNVLKSGIGYISLYTKSNNGDTILNALFFDECIGDRLNCISLNITNMTQEMIEKEINAKIEIDSPNIIYSKRVIYLYENKELITLELWEDKDIGQCNFIIKRGKEVLKEEKNRNIKMSATEEIFYNVILPYYGLEKELETHQTVAIMFSEDYKDIILDLINNGEVLAEYKYYDEIDSMIANVTKIVYIHNKIVEVCMPLTTSQYRDIEEYEPEYENPISSYKVLKDFNV